MMFHTYYAVPSDFSQMFRSYLLFCKIQVNKGKLGKTVEVFSRNFAVRATEMSQDVESLRPPRFFHEDGVIRPYREREGIGSQMLQVTSLLWCSLLPPPRPVVGISPPC